MAITSISRMQQRRGLRADLPPSLAEGEFGWCLDTRELFIGNGIGFGGNTPILTRFSANDTLITNRFRTKSSVLPGTVARTLGSKLNDAVSVMDFGATGDGVTDDAPAINAAIVALYQTSLPVDDVTKAKRLILRMPPGTYRIKSPLLLYPFLALVGEGIGRTVVLMDQDDPPICMIRTADSQGETGANIGIGSALFPQRIIVSNISFDTNGVKANIALLERYQGIRFEDVQFKGGWESSDGLTDISAAVTLSAVSTMIETVGAQFIRCEFRDTTVGVMANDLVYHTTFNECSFFRLYAGIVSGEVPVYGGPYNMVVSQSRFYSLDGVAIFSAGTNPGVTSIGNYIDGTVEWAPDSTGNSSICDIVLGVSPGITNLGTNNLILGPTRMSLPTLMPPSMTTTDRDLIIADNGMLIYNTTINRFQGYQNGAWINIDNGTPA